jgi:undecaprenyl-phosphate galactose phosphotransferase
MTVITPVKSDYGRPDSRSAALTLRSRGQTRRAVCAVALVAADAAAFAISLALSMALLARLAAPMALAGVPSYGLGLSVALPLAGVLCHFAGRLHYGRRMPFWSELRDVLAASGVGLLCGGFIAFLLQIEHHRMVVMLTWVMFPIAVLVMRAGVRGALSSAGFWRLRALVIGGSESAGTVTGALLSEPALGYDVVGVVSPDEPLLRHGAGRWTRLMQQHDAELLVLALDARDQDSRSLTESLVRERVPFAAMPRLDGLPVLGFEPTCFFSHDTMLFSYRNNLAQPVSRISKMVFDVCAAMAMLIVLAPLLLCIAILVKLDGGPVLFAHRRIGANGREFRCLKFRSMVTDGDAVLRRLLDSDPAAAAEWSETRKLRNDPRVTRIGRLLRSTSLDELPQLFNVLRLEMSLVGPRPIVRSEVARYGEDIAYYYETRPGLTGLWQVSGRSETSYDRRVQLDTWYVKNWTLWHDLAILAKTLPAVLKRRGAV